MDNRIDHANPFTNQIFQEAVIRNDMAIVKLLLRYGINPKRNERNRQGLTALQQCVLDGNGRMAILLLEAGADIEAKTSNGWTCLHIASALGDLDILATLVNHCCDLVALTKNEELPIDLGASRDIKIKLAREMSRIGYSELAQWYMRKLAAREGVFYVLSADTLLDLACDDKQDVIYRNNYLYYDQQQQYNQHEDIFIQQSMHNSNRAVEHAIELNAAADALNRDIWFDFSPQDQMTYLTYSSGYISEVVFDPTSGQYSNKVLTSTLTDSPQRKIIDERVSLASISEVDGAPSSFEEPKSRNGTLKRTSSTKRNNQNANRKPSAIELHIDYTNATESDEDIGDPFENEPEPVSQSSPVGTPSKQKLGVVSSSSPNTKSLERVRESEERKSSTETLTATKVNGTGPLPNSEYSDQQGSSEMKSRNVKFNPGDASNEFCNCPNCKKLGYAFSPDIQAGKAFHVPKGLNMIPPVSQSGMMEYNDLYYPATTTSANKNGSFYYNQPDNHYKPQKRKKKLFSGFKSIFKDVKVRTNVDNPAACDDAGILFSVSLRDKNKAGATRQRSHVRRSNSFSGSVSNDKYQYNEEVHVIPHSEVVAPPTKFSDHRQPSYRFSQDHHPAYKYYRHEDHSKSSHKYSEHQNYNPEPSSTPSGINIRSEPVRVLAMSGHIYHNGGTSQQLNTPQYIQCEKEDCLQQFYPSRNTFKASHNRHHQSNETHNDKMLYSDDHISYFDVLPDEFESHSSVEQSISRSQNYAPEHQDHCCEEALTQHPYFDYHPSKAHPHNSMPIKSERQPSSRVPYDSDSSMGIDNCAYCATHTYHHISNEPTTSNVKTGSIE